MNPRDPLDFEEARDEIVRRAMEQITETRREQQTVHPHILANPRWNISRKTKNRYPKRWRVSGTPTRRTRNRYKPTSSSR